MPSSHSKAVNARCLTIPLYLLVVLIATPINSFAQDSELQKRFETQSEKVQELDWMIGTWERNQVWLSNDFESRFFIKCQWIWRKTAIQCDNYDDQEIKNAGDGTIYSWNPEIEAYTSYEFSIGHYGFLVEGNLFKNGENWINRFDQVNPRSAWLTNTVYTPNGDTIEGAMFRSTNGGELKQMSEFTMTRVD